MHICYEATFSQTQFLGAAASRVYHFAGTKVGTKQSHAHLNDTSDRRVFCHSFVWQKLQTV
jgi:hypothetical protein